MPADIVWAAASRGSRTYHLLSPGGTLPFVCAVKAVRIAVAQSRTDWVPPRFATVCPRCREWQDRHPGS